MPPSDDGRAAASGSRRRSGSRRCRAPPAHSRGRPARPCAAAGPGDPCRAGGSTPSRRRRMPMIARKVVVLPAPLRPSSVTVSPSRMSRSTPCRTWLSPYQALSPRTSRRGALLMLGSHIGFAHARILADRVVGRRRRGSRRAARTVTRSQRSATTFRLCSTISTVRFLAMRRIRSEMRPISSWPMPAIGSSSSSMAGSSASVVAISSARLRP